MSQPAPVKAFRNALAAFEQATIFLRDAWARLEDEGYRVVHSDEYPFRDTVSDFTTAVTRYRDAVEIKTREGVRVP